jgi:hypothetical protein
VNEHREGVMIASPCPLDELSLVHRRPPVKARPCGRARILRCRRLRIGSRGSSSRAPLPVADAHLVDPAHIARIGVKLGVATVGSVAADDGDVSGASDRSDAEGSRAGRAGAAVGWPMNRSFRRGDSGPEPLEGEGRRRRSDRTIDRSWR